MGEQKRGCPEQTHFLLPLSLANDFVFAYGIGNCFMMLYEKEAEFAMSKLKKKRKKIETDNLLSKKDLLNYSHH